MITRYGPDSAEYHTEMMDFASRIVAEHRPRRVLFANHWLNRWCTSRWPLQSPPNCNLKKLQDHNKYLLGYIRKFQQLGAEVSSIAVDIEYSGLHPLNMFDFNGIIQQNIKPFRLSQFKNNYKLVIDGFENAMREGNVSIIDLSDNLCWEDSCEVLSPSGYGVYVDENHYTRLYSLHWLSVVDHLTEF